MKNLIIGAGYLGSAIQSYIGGDFCDWKFNKDYGELTKEDIRPYDNIIYVAGHSSVLQCIADPYGAWDNNVTKFKNLIEKIQAQTLIYASSGSVYNKCQDVTEDNKVFNLTNHLDLAKFTMDQLTQLSMKNVYGLRFGTVAGWSPKMRSDLMINKMYANRDTLSVKIANPKIRRAILATSDLVRAIKAIIDKPINPGIYNLSSFTKTVEEIGKEVADNLGIGVEYLPDTLAYDFDMDTNKFRNNYNFQFKGTIETILQGLRDEKIN